MKKVGIILMLMVTVLAGCKLIGRTAAKYWTKKQIKEFIANCETKASPLVGADKAEQYCDCAVDVVAEKYQNYEDIKSVPIREVLRIAKDCK